VSEGHHATVRHIRVRTRPAPGIDYNQQRILTDVAAIDRRHQYRLALCGHKALEAGTVCLVLMVQGDLTAITLGHLAIAAKTGLLAVVPALGLTFTSYARHFLNRWTTSAFLGGCTFVADALIHASHYPGEYTEAALTGIGAFCFSLAVSYTPVGKQIDRMAEALLE
jgi:hypothetical protein